MRNLRSECVTVTSTFHWRINMVATAVTVSEVAYRGTSMGSRYELVHAGMGF